MFFWLFYMVKFKSSMILLVHMIFGAAIGSLFRSPATAIASAVLSHYFLDLFPHIEYLESTENLIVKTKKGKLKNIFPDAIKVLFDFMGGLLLVIFFSDNNILTYGCIIAAIAPDGLTIINSVFPNKITRIHHKIHGEKIHFLKNNKKISKFWRIISQVTAIVVGIIIYSF